MSAPSCSVSFPFPACNQGKDSHLLRIAFLIRFIPQRRIQSPYLSSRLTAFVLESTLSGSVQIFAPNPRIQIIENRSSRCFHAAFLWVTCVHVAMLCTTGLSSTLDVFVERFVKINSRIVWIEFQETRDQLKINS